MKIIKKADSIFERIISYLAFLAAFFIVFAMLITGLIVAIRYIFGESMPWMAEIVDFSLLWLTFLATAWVLKEDRHVKMDMVVTRLSLRNQSILNTVTSIIGAAVCLIITHYGIQLVWRHFQSGYLLSRFLQPPSYIILAIIPVGSLLLFIQFLRMGYKHLKRQPEVHTE